MGNEIGVLFELVLSKSYTLYAFLISIFIFLVIMGLIFSKHKWIGYTLPILYSLLFIFIILYYSIDFKTWIDLFVSNIGSKPYFPSISLYYLFLFLSAFFLFVGIIWDKVSKFTKIINTGSFLFLQFFFLQFMSTLKASEIAMSNWPAIYHEVDSMAIVNVSCYFFIIWLLNALSGFVINQVLKDERMEDEYTKDEIVDNKKIDELDEIKKEIYILKEKTNLNYNDIKERINSIEESLAFSNQYFLDELNNYREAFGNSEVNEILEDIESLVFKQYKDLQEEVKSLKEMPTYDVDVLESKVRRLDDMMILIKDDLDEKVEYLKDNSPNEVKSLEEKISRLEFGMQRYQEDFLHELKKTKKEIEVTIDNKRRNKNKVED